MNNNEPPQKSPKNWEKKQAFLTLLKQCQTHQKQTFNTKTSKKQTQKTPFCHVQKQPTIVHKFSVFSTYSFCFWKAVFCWKHYKNSVFRKTQLFKNTVSKTHFFNHVKKHPFPKKRCHFLFFFFAISSETPIFIVFPALHCFGPKKIWPKQIVCTTMRVFSPFLTQIVSGNFC